MIANTPRRSLLWRLVGTTAPVLVVAAVALIVTPISISSNPVLTEALALGAGLAIMLAVLVVLVRWTLSPLRELTRELAAIDPGRPGQRVREPEAAPREVEDLARAFNGLLERVETEQRRSARAALSAQEEERLRIAREIHDQVGQTLTAATIEVERAASSDGPVDDELLDRIARSVQQGLDDVRRIGRDLRPEALDDLGLGNALITLCRRMSVADGVRVSARLPSAGAPLSPEVELVVYRIAQEAITNAVRHAGAAQILLTLERPGEAVELRVADDGRGLPELLPEDTAGIAGMRERARLVDGELELRRLPEGGTEVRLAVPGAVAT